MNERVIDRVEVPKVSLDWNRVAPWWRLASQALAISWRFSHLLAGMLSIALIVVVRQIADTLFGPVMRLAAPNVAVDPIWTTWQFLISPWVEPTENPFALTRMAHVLFSWIGTALVLGMVGGMMARRATIELGTRSSVGWVDAWTTVRKRWLSLLWTMLMPWGTALLVLAPMFVLGLLGRFVGGDSLGYVVLIPGCLLIAPLGWLALLGILGFPLAVTAVVSERNADAFDGFSRSSAYLSQRPITVGLCLVAAWGVGGLAMRILRFGMDWGGKALLTTYEAGMGREFADGASAPVLIQDVTGWFLMGFGLSFFWSASSAMYLILRREIDHTDYDELDVDEIGSLPPPVPQRESEEKMTPTVSSTEGQGDDNAPSAT